MTCLIQHVFTVDSPILAKDYHKKAAQGFSTNFFKTQDFSKYNKTNIKDVKDAGFNNLRLRCRTDLDGYNMTVFLDNLETVVDDCIAEEVAPIISWINHEAEANGTETDRENYLTWWEQVAKRLKDKSYLCSLNLFTELGLDVCGNSCEASLRMNTTKYNDWTSAVVKKIRNSGGRNDKRIIILGSPKKTASGLDDIDSDIYTNDTYMMAEWHSYASGPNKKILSNGKKSPKYWKGDGAGDEGKDQVDAAISEATDFTDETKIPTLLGAWMPQDNKNGSLTQDEVIKFARYFVKKLEEANIPWCLNVLDVYYDTASNQWIKDNQTIAGQSLDMWKVLTNIKKVM